MAKKNTLISPNVIEVLNRLFTAAEESETALEQLAQSEASRLITSKSGYREFYGLMKDIPLPVSRETGSLLYMLTRSTRAQCILEFGTSYGVSTIYLAAALRDNGGGRIITTEFESSKVERARQNLTQAGLMDLVEIREGDALQTLAQDLPETLDLVLLDGAKGLYTDILECVEQRLHPGSLVIADDTHRCPDYVQSIRANAQKYLSMPLTDDVELSMRLS
jgi:predicted O-methyltransferase YrrM